MRTLLKTALCVAFAAIAIYGACDVSPLADYKRYASTPNCTNLIKGWIMYSVQVDTNGTRLSDEANTNVYYPPQFGIAYIADPQNIAALSNDEQTLSGVAQMLQDHTNDMSVLADFQARTNFVIYKDRPWPLYGVGECAALPLGQLWVVYDGRYGEMVATNMLIIETSKGRDEFGLMRAEDVAFLYNAEMGRLRPLKELGPERGFAWPTQNIDRPVLVYPHGLDEAYEEIVRSEIKEYPDGAEEWDDPPVAPVRYISPYPRTFPGCMRLAKAKAFIDTDSGTDYNVWRNDVFEKTLRTMGEPWGIRGSESTPWPRHKPMLELYRALAVKDRIATPRPLFLNISGISPDDKVTLRSSGWGTFVNSNDVTSATMGPMAGFVSTWFYNDPLTEEDEDYPVLSRYGVVTTDFNVYVKDRKYWGKATTRMGTNVVEYLRADKQTFVREVSYHKSGMPVKPVPFYLAACFPEGGGVPPEMAFWIVEYAMYVTYTEPLLRDPWNRVTDMEYRIATTNNFTPWIRGVALVPAIFLYHGTNSLHGGSNVYAMEFPRMEDMAAKVFNEVSEVRINGSRLTFPSIVDLAPGSVFDWHNTLYENFPTTVDMYPPPEAGYLPDIKWLMVASETDVTYRLTPIGALLVFSLNGRGVTGIQSESMAKTFRLAQDTSPDVLNPEEWFMEYPVLYPAADSIWGSSAFRPDSIFLRHFGDRTELRTDRVPLMRGSPIVNPPILPTERKLEALIENPLDEYYIYPLQLD